MLRNLQDLDNDKIHAITGGHGSARSVSIDLSRDSISKAPQYDPVAPWSDEQDLRLHRHHGRHGHRAAGRLLETEL